MYHFQKLKQVEDVRNKIEKGGKYTDYGIGSKTDIAIHHSLTKSGDAFAFSRYHYRNNGWQGGLAYHFVIKKDGVIQWGQDLGARSYHVGNANTYALGICLVGDFRNEKPTEEQKKSLYELHGALVKDLPNYKRTLGHSDYPQYSWKACPVFDWKAVIFGGDNPIVKEQKKAKCCDHDGCKCNKADQREFVVHEIKKGDTLWSIAKDNDVKVEDLKKLNPDVDTKALKIGDKIKIKKLAKPSPKVEPKHIGVVTITTAVLNVRENPSLEAGIVKVVKKGETYKVYDKSVNGWLNVGGNQWISGSEKYSDYEPVDFSIGTLTVQVPVLNVRDDAGVHGHDIGDVKKGEKYKVFAEKNGWYKVSEKGWVSGKYVTFTKK